MRPGDFERLVRVARLAVAGDVEWLTADFNCTVVEPAYVNEILDRLRNDHPRIYGMILYVEQPFPYELESYPIDVHSVSARKPLFLVSIPAMRDTPSERVAHLARASARALKISPPSSA